MKKYSVLLLVAMIFCAPLSLTFAQESMPPAQTEQVTPDEVAEDGASTAVDEAPVVETDPSEPETPVVVPVEQPEVSNGEFFTAATDAVKQIATVLKAEGASKVTIVLTILIVLSQLLIQFTKTSIFGSVFKKVGDQGKLLIVTGATTAVTIATLMLGGVGFLPAITSGAGLSAIMVFGHQIYKAFIEKKPKTA